ncbi:MAG: RagB/SusD family nutrient uptake outer membrane protein [Bacteroidales bacterium]|nr:RagB/SusD family nutrient uptake outer membrane protein [Bacteroidales bacterium]
MKKIFYTLVSMLLVLSFHSCQDASSLLDKEESNDIYEDMVFSDAYNAVWFLNGVYAQMNPGYEVFGSVNSGGFLGNAVDEGSWKANWDNASKMSAGAWTTSDNLLAYNPWNRYYSAIRAANKFMEHVDEIPDSSEPVVDAAIRTRMKAEARFLRAMFYYELLKFYGGVPIITRTLLASEEDELKKARSTFDETVEFICTEAKAAREDLPNVNEYADTDWGRATKGACDALVCRVRLMAASPFFNNPSDPEDKPWHGAYDANKWVVAAEAARDFLVNNPSYSMHVSTDPSRYGDYEDLYIRRYSPEVILAYQHGQTMYIERNCLPGNFFNYAFGVVNNFPTLNQVSEYEILDIDDDGNVTGSHLLGWDTVKALYDNAPNVKDPVTGFNPQDPYVNRDPRFYQSIWYNGEAWPAAGTSEATTKYFATYTGGAQDCIPNGFFFTGFYNRKFLDPWALWTAYGSNIKVNHNFIIFRLGEIYLNYAEAMNEAYGPETVPAGFTMSALDAINIVRTRVKYPQYDIPDYKYPAGMPKKAAGKSLPPVPTGLTKDQFRERVIHERRVELYQEEARFFDLNRWKKRESFTIYRQEMTKDAGTGVITFGYKELFKKTFKDKFYLFPIQENEITKCPLLEQNPGWSGLDDTEDNG